MLRQPRVLPPKRLYGHQVRLCSNHRLLPHCRMSLRLWCRLPRKLQGTEDATGLPFHFFQDKSYEPAGIVGTVYKGGFIVPIIWTLFITVIALAIERWFAISTANGKGNLGKFAAAVKSALKQGDVAKAEQLCNQQQGSVANVVLAALTEYKKQQGTDLETERRCSLFRRQSKKQRRSKCL